MPVLNTGGEKKRLLINRDYNIDNYESIITFPKIDFYLFFFVFCLFFKPETSSHWLPLHGPQSGAKICFSIPELFHA